MGLIDGIIFAVALALLGFGVAFPLSSATANEFLFSRLCFTAAAAELVGLCVYWLGATDRFSFSIKLIIGAISGALIASSTIGGLKWIDGRQYPNGTKKVLPTPLTLRNLFDTDFSDRWSSPVDYSLVRERDNTTFPMPVRLLLDFDGKAAFLAIFISHTADPQESFKQGVLMSATYNVIVGRAKAVYQVGVLSLGETSRTWVKDLVFTDHVFLYYEDDLSSSQIAFLEQTYKDRGLSVEIRSHDYLMAHRYDQRTEPNRFSVITPAKVDIP